MTNNAKTTQAKEAIGKHRFFCGHRSFRGQAVKIKNRILIWQRRFSCLIMHRYADYEGNLFHQLIIREIGRIQHPCFKKSIFRFSPSYFVLTTALRLNRLLNCSFVSPSQSSFCMAISSGLRAKSGSWCGEAKRFHGQTS